MRQLSQTIFFLFFSLNCCFVVQSQEISPVFRHSGKIDRVVFSSDNPYMVAISKDNIRIFNTNTGLELHNFTEYKNVKLVAISPDAKYIALATRTSPNRIGHYSNQAIYIIDIHSTEIINKIEIPFGKHFTKEIWFQKNGRALTYLLYNGATIFDKNESTTIYVHHIKKDKTIGTREYTKTDLHFVEPNIKGGFFVSLDDENKLMSMKTPATRSKLKGDGGLFDFFSLDKSYRELKVLREYKGYEGDIMHLDLSPDGNTIAALSSSNTLYIFQSTYKDCHCTYKTDATIEQVHAGKKNILLVDSMGIDFIDPVTCIKLDRLAIERKLAIEPYGEWLLTIEDERLELIDMASKKSVRTFQPLPSTPLLSTVIIPNNPSEIKALDNKGIIHTISINNFISNGSMIRSSVLPENLQNSLITKSISNEQTILAAEKSSVYFYNTVNGKLESLSLTRPPLKIDDKLEEDESVGEHVVGLFFRILIQGVIQGIADNISKEYNITDCAVSPDSKYAVLSGKKGKQELFHLDSSWSRELYGHEQKIYTTQFSPNGKYFISGGDSGLFVYSTYSWDTIYTLPNIDWVTKMCISSNNIAIAGNSMDYVAWNVATKEILWNKRLPYMHGIWISDNGEDFYGISQDTILQRYTTSQLDSLQPLTIGIKDIIDINFSQKSNYLGILDKHGVIHMLNMGNGEILYSMYLYNNNSDVVIFTPDNYYYTSDNDVSAVNFKMDNDAYSFKQFDVYFNRPDIVFSRMGLPDGDTLKLFKGAYSMRAKNLTPLGSTNSKRNTLSNNIPSLNLEECNKPYLISGKNIIQLHVSAHDKNSRLTEFNIKVNGIPVKANSTKIAKPSKK